MIGTCDDTSRNSVGGPRKLYIVLGDALKEIPVSPAGDLNGQTVLDGGLRSHQDGESVATEPQVAYGNKPAPAAGICSKLMENCRLLASMQWPSPWPLIVMCLPGVTTPTDTVSEKVPSNDSERLPADQTGEAPYPNKPPRPRSATSKATFGSNTSRKQQAKQRLNAAQTKLFLRSALLLYHRFESVDFNPQPATQRQLGEILGWDQSRVSRAMAMIFGKYPMAIYGALCRSQRRIQGFLQKLDDGTYRADGIVNRSEGRDCDEDIHY